MLYGCITPHFTLFSDIFTIFSLVFAWHRIQCTIKKIMQNCTKTIPDMQGWKRNGVIVKDHCIKSPLQWVTQCVLFFFWAGLRHEYSFLDTASVSGCNKNVNMSLSGALLDCTVLCSEATFTSLETSENTLCVLWRVFSFCWIKASPSGFRGLNES